MWAWNNPKKNPWTLTFKVQHGPNSPFESETSNKASGMAPTCTLERMNIKSQEAFGFITAFYESVCRDVKPRRAVSFFFFFFFTSLVWVLRGSALPSLWIFFLWPERKHWQAFCCRVVFTPYAHGVALQWRRTLRLHTDDILQAPSCSYPCFKFVFPYSSSAANRNVSWTVYKNYT